MAIVSNTNSYSVSRIPDFVADTKAELDAAIAIYVGNEVLTLDDGKIYYVSSGSEDAPTTPELIDIKYDNAGLLEGEVVDEESHNDLDQLVHDVAETAHEEINYSGNQLDSIIIWTDSGKTIKIREWLFTYMNNRINTEIIKQYDVLGVLITGQTLTGTYTYVGNNIDNIEWVKS